MNKRRLQRISAWILGMGMVTGGSFGGIVSGSLAQGQAPATSYQPKFAGDPARSESEAQALAYMRTLLRAEHLYKKKHDKYAESLAALAGTGTFTRRMAHSTERGDYTVGFRPHKDGFILTMTPKQMDAERRSFYAEEDGVIHGDDQKPADAQSPKVR